MPLRILVDVSDFFCSWARGRGEASEEVAGAPEKTKIKIKIEGGGVTVSLLGS